MPPAPQKIQAIFHEAVEQHPPTEWPALLDQACGSDPELRHAVEALLRGHEQQNSLLDQPAASSATAAELKTAGPGTVIGPYKLLQQIGEGGMGVVWMAEQTQPVHRKVALKVIKPGMDSRQVIARFEAERQALAMMDHVNIARVFDGGATESGRLYFVMELVHGVPITRYCDDNHLTPRERLELFVPVCQAIQHAHQKGIIHRDIKPSNVMVTLYDGKPVPKVIDFGVAKAIEQKLTERTLFTQYGAMVGTLEYMSPEQAEMSALGVDTRSDIYSLGVLLYELLTGTTPLTHKRMKEAAYAEILRMIKEEEPPKPSTRLSDSGEALASISAQRKTEPTKLSKLMRGELDWIVMKTLEKDRNRRYETANGFAHDIQRYLTDEPVQACPPSAGYRFRKFARRNRSALLTACAVSAALVAGTVTSTWLAIRATHARTEAETSRQHALANLRKAHDAVDRMLTHVGEQELAQVPQMQKVQRKLLEDALEFNQAFLATEAGNPALALEVAKAQVRVGVINLNMGLYATAEQACNTGIEMLQALSREAPHDRVPRAELVRVHNHIAHAQDKTDPTGKKSEGSRRRAVALADQLVAENPGSRSFKLFRAESLVMLGSTLVNLTKLEEAEGILRQGLEAARAIDDQFYVGKSAHQLGRLCLSSGRLEQAERHLLDAVEALRRHGHEGTWVHRLSMGNVRIELRQLFEKMGKIENAQVENSKALVIFDGLARDYPDRLTYAETAAHTADWLAISLEGRGRNDEAAVAYRKALEIQFRLLFRAPLEARRHDDLNKRFGALDALLIQTKRITERRQIGHDVLTLYDSLLVDHPDSPTLKIGRNRFLAHLASLAVSHGTPAEAEQSIQRALEGWGTLAREDPSDADDHRSLIESCGLFSSVLIAAGRRHEAQRFCTRAIKKWPNTALLHLSRARVFVAQEQPEKALADFSKTIELAPKENDTPWRYHERSSVYAILKQDGKALADLDTAVREWPGVWDVWVWRGAFHYHRKQWHQAIADYTKAETLNAPYWPAWHFRGSAYAQLQQWDKAIADYTKAAEMNPSGVQPHHDLAWLLATCPNEKLREPARAVASAKKAVDLAPHAGHLWSTLGIAHYRAGEWKSAIEVLTKSMKLGNGGDSLQWFFVAMAHWKLDRKLEARTWYDQAAAWMDKHAPQREELRRFRAEATKLLGIKKTESK